MLTLPLPTAEMLIGAGKSSQIQLLRDKLRDEKNVFLEESVEK